MTKCAFAALLVLFYSLTAFAAEPPTIPVGADAYLQWEKWPLQRIGDRAYMRGTYDRKGGNEGADASHFLYQLADDQNVTLDLEGPGALVFARYNHWHGSPWHYTVDGDDTVVQETSSKDPTKPVQDSIFEPAASFPSSLTYTWAQTKGADLSWVPIEFEKSFRMAYSRTHYGTGYYIFHKYVPGIPLSHAIGTWTAQTPDARVVQLAGSAADELVVESAFSPWPGKLRLNGPGVIRKLAFSIPLEGAAARSNARLKITWDERNEPSIDAPLALFFGAGVLGTRGSEKYEVKAFPISIRSAGDRLVLTCCFPMPFFRSATIELAGSDTQYAVEQVPLHNSPNEVGYLHATHRDHPTPERGKDLILLDTRGIEGSQDWSGSFVGTSFIFSHNAVLNTLEGDPRFFFDDSLTPQGQGTGTEEWGGGGDYWGGRNMTLPFAGHPCGAPSAKEAKSDDDKIESAYRFLLADLFPFGRNAKICLEHGGTNESKEHYETVTYWYGLPAASIVKTDTLKIGDDASEKSHQYGSPDASPPYQITSRYELGVDHLGSDEIYPAQTDTGRTTTGTTEFTLKLKRENLGVLLRRKLDYQFPNQRAEVSIANVDGESVWKPAGIWYLAGSNSCVYSNPKEELGATQHNVETSNRRFRDDEFLIGRDLTSGRDAIRVRIKFTPVPTPLFPGRAVGALAWSEIRYDAYCFVMPQFKP